MADDSGALRLHHLAVFEMAARRGSFTRASEALGISQPAVSHTVCSLEAQLGVKLFERRHKGVVPTDAGRYLYEQVNLGLTLIDQAVREVRKLSAPDQVTLAVSTATATWWLLPRVARFKQANPHIDLRCITTDNDLDLEAGGIDLAITLGTSDWSRYARWRIFEEVVFPVCSPSYARELGDCVTPLTLATATLLRLEQRYRPRLDWPQWLAQFGVSLPRAARQFRFNDYSIVLHAALEGQGVALGWRHIVATLLEQGRLVRPLTEQVVTDHPIYIIASRSRHMRPSTALLRDWLLAEARDDATRLAAPA